MRLRISAPTLISNIAPKIAAKTRSSAELRLIALALIFGWLGALTLAVQRQDGRSLAALAALSLGSLATHVWLNRVAPGRDITLTPIVTALLGFGLVMIVRVAPNFVWRQLGALGVAMVALWMITARDDQLRWLRRFKYTWLFAAFALLAATLVFGVNPAGFGARLWLSLGGTFFQPSEILRLLMIAFLAAYFAERLETRLTRLQIIPSAVMWLVAILLLILQQDFGVATLLLMTFGVMLYLATGDVRLPLALFSALLVAGVVGYFLSARVAQRLSIWINPWADPQGSSFQVVQSLIAIASGGIFGQGINQGRPDYVPAVHTDFPFVMIAEELGLIGSLGLIACYATFSLQTWRIALRSKSAYRMLLAGGIAAAFAIQVFVILGGNMSLVPLTGVTLPFVSVGGTSLVTSFIALGLLIRISAIDDRMLAATMRDVRPHLTRASQRSALVTSGLFAALALTTGLWSVVRSHELTTRDDNPRQVDAELGIQRGPVVDRSGQPIVYSSPVSSTNTALRYERHSIVPEAAPAVGYYSQRYGTGGIEAFADKRLRGDRSQLDMLLHRPQIGSPVTLTLDKGLQVRLQMALQSAVPHTVTRGAAIVLDASSGEVLALASAPSFDPNTLDVRWKQLTSDPFAPLVNRTTQGLYQPGALLSWMVTSQAARHMPTGNGPRDKRPDQGPEASTWRQALAIFSLDQPLPFELPNQAVPYPATLTVSETLGQGTLRVTPLRIAAVAAQLATGEPMTPTLEMSRALPRRPVLPVPSITTFARISADRFVGWLVQMVDTRVIVVAIEMPDRDASTLERVAQAARAIRLH